MGPLQRHRSEHHEQVADGLRAAGRVGDADELAHHAEPAIDADRATGRIHVAGDQRQQRRLADAVGADERGPLAVADGEADIMQQLDAAGKTPAEVADANRAHGRGTLGSAGGADVTNFGATARRLVEHVA